MDFNQKFFQYFFAKAVILLVQDKRIFQRRYPIPTVTPQSMLAVCRTLGLKPILVLDLAPSEGGID